MRRRLAFALTVAVLAVWAGACRSADPAPQQETQDLVLDGQPGGGYAFKGPYGLAGTLTYGAQGWYLAGVFQFPAGGYRVGAIDIQVMKSLPEQVQVTIYVLVPPKGAMTTQVITEEAVERSIPVSGKAQFAIRVSGAHGS